MNTAPVVHVSFPTPDPEDPFPAMIPMIGFMALFENPEAATDEPLDLYLHGYISSRLMKLGGTSPGEEEGLPVTIAVSTDSTDASRRNPIVKRIPTFELP